MATRLCGMISQPEPVPAPTRVPPRPDLRIGDAERDRVCTALAEHFTAGRLRNDEFDERVALAVRAQTETDLRMLLADLPALSVATATPPATPTQVEPRQPHQQASGMLVLDVLLGMFGALAAICLGLLMVLTISARDEGPYPVIAFLAALGGAAVAAAITHFLHRRSRRGQ